MYRGWVVRRALIDDVRDEFASLMADVDRRCVVAQLRTAAAAAAASDSSLHRLVPTAPHTCLYPRDTLCKPKLVKVCKQEEEREEKKLATEVTQAEPAIAIPSEAESAAASAAPPPLSLANSAPAASAPQEDERGAEAKKAEVQAQLSPTPHAAASALPHADESLSPAVSSSPPSISADRPHEDESLQVASNEQPNLAASPPTIQSVTVPIAAAAASALSSDSSLAASLLASSHVVRPIEQQIESVQRAIQMRLQVRTGEIQTDTRRIGDLRMRPSFAAHILARSGCAVHSCFAPRRPRVRVHILLRREQSRLCIISSALVVSDTAACSS